METNVVRTTCPLIGNGQSAQPAEDREESMRILLQLFASDPVDISQIVSNGVEIFKTADADGAEGGDNEEQETEGEDPEEISDEPILFPRLSVTDLNLPQTEIGEMVVRDEDGTLLTVTVDKGGEVTERPFMIGEDNIEDGSISASKLAEGSITSREVDLGDLFSDTSVLNQLIAANIDTDDLFLNEQFIEKFNAGSIEAVTAKINEIVAGTVTTDALYAAIADIVALRVGKITAQTIDADELYAALANVVKLRIDEAVAGTVTTDGLHAALADIANAQIARADIEQLLVDQAIISEGSAGKFLIERLSVTEANMASLSVGELMVRGRDGHLYRIIPDENGGTTTIPAEVDGADLMVNSIKASTLDVEEIFADSAFLGGLSVNISPYSNSEPPENPRPGQLWRNPKTNALMVWLEDESGGDWVVVVDPKAVAHQADQIAELQSAIDGAELQTIIDSAQTIKKINDHKGLLDDLAGAMDFSEQGLTIESYSKEFASRVAPQQFELLKKIDDVYKEFAIFGLLKTTTSPFIQIGMDNALNPKMKLGMGVFEFNSSTKNLTCRKA